MSQQHVNLVLTLPAMPLACVVPQNRYLKTPGYPRSASQGIKPHQHLHQEHGLQNLPAVLAVV